MCVPNFLSEYPTTTLEQHNQTSTLRWTIHRPKRGWYIRIRSPTFPPGVFISLLPVPRSSPDYTDAALHLSCRTIGHPSPPPVTTAKVSNPQSSRDSVDSDATVVHSYPPTPPVAPVVITPPSPRSLNARLDEISPAPPGRRGQPPSRITQFLLAPHSTPHIPSSQQADLFSRAMTLFKNHKPSHSLSFTLTSVDNIRRIQQAPGPSQTNQGLSWIPATPTPLLVFHDTTPVMTVRSTTGLLEINRAEERVLGVETSFWIAVSLTYLEFLEDKEVSLASSSEPSFLDPECLQSYLAAMSD